jgi:hypothetical protein
MEADVKIKNRQMKNEEKDSLKRVKDDTKKRNVPFTKKERSFYSKGAFLFPKRSVSFLLQYFVPLGRYFGN